MAKLRVVFWFVNTDGRCGIGQAFIEPPHDTRNAEGIEEIERRIVEADEETESVCLIDWKILEN